jgi:hypothetical protein
MSRPTLGRRRVRRWAAALFSGTIESIGFIRVSDPVFAEFEMEPDELKAWLRRGPVRIRMNNGDTYEVPGPEFALISDYSVAVLTRDNGRMLNRLLALINISEVSEHSKPADKASS